MHKSAQKNIKVSELDLCNVFLLSRVLSTDMHFNLPKAMHASSQQHDTSMILLLHGKVNTGSKRQKVYMNFYWEGKLST